LLAAQQAAASSGGEFTDDSSMLEAAGLRVRVIPGEVENVKVTYPEDRLVVERILRERGGSHGR
jgi:2-C-methyl-D-erythritol 4-phosphate cytidylyltransferase